ncbi:hypothetical protein [Hoeflea sp. BAL378]|uniref:hypothetical protein n=1 Tax=Hoeflea sp. BAL378 TaxID=1547437 RepID=UPI00126A7A19|nr:hypothetical protein [Hoeflea sp. BAL378]
MDQITPEFLMTVLTGALFGLAAIGQYVRTKRQAPDHAITKDVQFHDARHAEQTLRCLERIAVAVEKIAASADTIADKRQTDIQETLHKIAEHMRQV